MVESNDKVTRQWLDSIELMDSIRTFKENMYSQTAKNKIDREKKRDAQKHDRMMDLARIRDTSAKNKQTTVKR